MHTLPATVGSDGLLGRSEVYSRISSVSSADWLPGGVAGIGIGPPAASAPLGLCARGGSGGAIFCAQTPAGAEFLCSIRNVALGFAAKH
jgi:hypothetical protein